MFSPLNWLARRNRSEPPYYDLGSCTHQQGVDFQLVVSDIQDSKVSFCSWQPVNPPDCLGAAADVNLGWGHV